MSGCTTQFCTRPRPRRIPRPRPAPCLSSGETLLRHGGDRRHSPRHRRRLGLAGSWIKTRPPPPFRLSPISTPSFALDSAVPSVHPGPLRARDGGCTPNPTGVLQLRVAMRCRRRAASSPRLARRLFSCSPHRMKRLSRSPRGGLRHETNTHRSGRRHRRRVVVGRIPSRASGCTESSVSTRIRWSVVDLGIHRGTGRSCGWTGAAVGEEAAEEVNFSERLRTSCAHRRRHSRSLNRSHTSSAMPRSEQHL